MSPLQRFFSANNRWLCASLCWLWTAQIAAQPTPPTEPGAAPEPAPPALAPEEPPAPIEGSLAGDAALADAGTAPIAADAGVAPASWPAPVPAEAVETISDTRALKGNGTLQGSVKASEDGSSVEGANVYVRGEPFQTHTDAQGRFRLDLPAGSYQISVIYPGYSTFTVSKVEVRPGKAANLNIELHAGSMVLDEFVIIGSRVEGGIATLIAERRDSTAVADVIGSEQMARSGDSNAAAALSRVTGITIVDGRYVIVRGMGERYSSMTLNRFQVASPDPTRRVVPLDLFPAGVIESVLVQKTYAPDLPGEFGGGLVQLRSRDYPHDFLLSVNVATGGNTKTLFLNRVTDHGGSHDWLGIDDGSRELPSSFEDERGKITTGIGSDYTREDVTQLASELPKSFNMKTERVVPDLTLVANVGNEFRLRRAKIGFVAAGGYRSEFRTVRDAINRFFAVGETMPSEDALVDTYRRQLSLSGFLDWGVEFSKQHKLKFTTMLLRQTDDNTQYRELVLPMGGNRRTILQWVERQVLLQQVDGAHVFERAHDFQVDWRYAFGRATRVEPNRRTYSYLQADAGDPYLLPTGSSSSESAFSDLRDDTHEGALDLTQPFRVWKRLQAKAKIGGLVYRRDRVADTRRFNLGLQDASGMLDRSLPPDRLLNDENIEAGIVRMQEVTRTTDAYDAYMQLEAGYGMLELPILSSLDLMGGARLEHAHIETSTFDAFDDSAPKVKTKLDNLDVLPATTLTWRFADDFQLRGGYSRTLNRPDFRELSPSRYFDLEQNLLLVGNPDVKRALIDNYDARIEWYLTPDEVFSIGGFLKDFTDPIETSQAPAAEEIYTVGNADHARSYGLELEGRKHFGFVAQALDALYVASNFSLIESTVEIDRDDGGIYKRPLQGQSPWVINVQLGWDSSGEGGTGTSASLLFNSAGRRIRVIGDPNVNQGDIYEAPIHRLDFVVAQDLKRGFKLGARARNLLNAVEKWTRDGELVRKQRRGTDLQLSLSWSY